MNIKVWKIWTMEIFMQKKKQIFFDPILLYQCKVQVCIVDGKNSNLQLGRLIFLLSIGIINNSTFSIYVTNTAPRQGEKTICFQVEYSTEKLLGVKT